MSFAFGHLIFAWIIGKSFEFISKKKISHLTWGFLLFGSVLPDIDFILGDIFGEYMHRMFTHGLLFILPIALVTYFLVRTLNSKSAAKKTTVFIIIGMLSHLFIDLFYFPGIQLFWPWNIFVYFFGAGYYTLADLAAISADKLALSIKRAIIDLGLGTAWIFFLWFRKKIRF